MFLLFDRIPEETIHRVVESTFGSSAYDKTSLWSRFWEWVGRMLATLFSWILPAFFALRRSPPLFWAVLIALTLLTAAVVARWIYLWRARTAGRIAGARWDEQGESSRNDAWSAAQQLAARGDYTAAAHALYAALLDAGARQNQLKLHPSKTAGDYVREVRKRSSPIFPTFRDFARAYELVIYGLGECDRERYERLLSLALPIVTARG
ncbi:MAG: DUF4129 domain-containing protein [Gemmatimonadota bacterium]